MDKQKSSINDRFQTSELHYFNDLACTFWDSENTILKKFKQQKERISKKKGIPSDKTETQYADKVARSYKIILTLKSKTNYLKNLQYFYICSQPKDIYQLASLHYYIVYPFYYFLINSNEYISVVINFIEYSLFFNNLKYEFSKAIEVSAIIDTEKIESEILLKINDKKKNIIRIKPKLVKQLDLIYALINFMKKKFQMKTEIKTNIVKEMNQNLENEGNDGKIAKIKNFKFDKLYLLETDSYIPNGVKISSYIYLDKKKDDFDRFVIIGTMYIFIFQDDSMNKILNVIPISPAYTFISYTNEIVNIKYGNYKLNIIFPDKNSLAIFKEIVNNIKEGVGFELLGYKELQAISFNNSNCHLDYTDDFVFDSPLFNKIVDNNESNLKEIKKLCDEKAYVNYLYDEYSQKFGKK